MPVKVRQIGRKYRVVEADSGAVATGSKGNPRDGGGHQSEAKAKRQAAIINAHLAKKGRI